MAQRKIELPWVRQAVMRDLALAATSQNEVARKYGVASSTMTAFAQKYSEAIANLRQNAADEFSGILIAQKANRLATYEALLGEALVTQEDGTIVVADQQAAARILKQVAEEMGHLPTRVQLAGEVGVNTRYEIVGVDPKDLT